ncbi:hypothetical protein ACFFRR_009396 [Megaselia abdita]
MTGKYPIHTGMQHTVLYGGEARGLPLTEKLLPEYLNQFGYSSHIAGKWHLGHYKKIYTPMYRGFKSHVGYWTGHHDYYDHTAVENPSWGLDIRRGLDVAYDLHGKYTTDIITEEAIRVIKNHHDEQTANRTMGPLFLYVAHAAVHSGNPYNPLPAPDSIVSKMNHIDDFNRRKYAAMLSKLDESVGTIVNQLHRNNMLQDSLIVFSTDNGGPAAGFNLNAASNWPLRGVKNTLWEGGVRGAGMLWYPHLKHKARVAEQRMQITDWLPTLLGSFGVSVENSTKIDGFNIWDSLSENNLSPRTSILHNIDEIWEMGSITIGDFKVIKGASPYQGKWDGWYGPSGRNYEYNVTEVMNSLSGIAIKELGIMPNESEIIDLRKEATLTCRFENKKNACNSIKEPCLYNIKNDPCELNNLAKDFPDILRDLLDKMENINKTALPPGNKPIDPRADPRYWSNTWTDFGDFISSY